MGYHVLRGRRPDKPGDAPTIGFSDSLWRFTQRCWDGQINLRPKAGEVAMQLGEAAAEWDGLMPPCVKAENAAPCSEEEASDSEFGEFENLTLPRYFPPNNGTDELFLPPLSHFPENPLESETGSGLFNSPNTPPAQCDEQSLREAIANLFRRLTNLSHHAAAIAGTTGI